jgi:hypothetical protein
MIELPFSHLPVATKQETFRPTTWQEAGHAHPELGDPGLVLAVEVKGGPQKCLAAS